MTIRPHHFILLTLLTFLLAGPAFADYLGGITFDTESPSYLPHGYLVNMTIDYKVDETGGARVFARPYTLGSPTPGYAASGGPLVGPGTGTASQYFTINYGESVVTHVRFTLVSPDQTETYLELFVPVHYVFAGHGIYNIRMDHGEYSRLPYERDLTIDFDYESSHTGNLRIFARPYTDGQLTPGYTASGSTSLPPSGSFSQYFHFENDADVTDILFRMWNDDQTELLYEFFVPYDIHWREVGMYNFSIDWPNGEALHNSQYLNVTWTVEHYATEARYAWANLLTGGAFSPNEAHQPSPQVPTGPQVVTRYAFITDGYTPVDAVRLRYGTTEEIIQEFTFPVDYLYGPHVTQNHQFEPQAPAILTNDEYLFMDFEYLTDQTGGVRIFSRPAYDGELMFGIASDGSPLYPYPGGLGDFYLRFLEGDRLASSMYFQITNDDQSVVLFERFVDGWWAWGGSGYITPAPDGLPSVAASLQAVYPNPFNPTTTIPVQINRATHLRLDVYDLRGRLVQKLHDGNLEVGVHNFTFNGDRLPSGTYFCRLKTPQGVASRGMTLVK
jgi:hypothetical protein